VSKLPSVCVQVTVADEVVMADTVNSDERLGGTEIIIIIIIIYSIKSATLM
jgi:hypothetical protein